MVSFSISRPFRRSRRETRTQAARKELKKREDDPILLDKIKALKLRLEKVKQESDFRDEYKDDPCVLQCLYLIMALVGAASMAWSGVYIPPRLPSPRPRSTREDDPSITEY